MKVDLISDRGRDFLNLIVIFVHFLLSLNRKRGCLKKIAFYLISSILNLGNQIFICQLTMVLLSIVYKEIYKEG